MSDNSSNNKRIAKNTLFLYIRTLIVMLVTLFTSRVLLQKIGQSDYGIYNLVGGIVVLFSFLNSAMSTATQRFLNIELGKNDEKQAERVFSMSMNVHVAIALLVLVLAETVGLWFVSTQLNIPEDRYTAVHWVYQFSVLGCCTNIIRIPYNASIIAYEKMSFFAKVSLIEAVLKLLIVYMLMISPMDLLAFYSILMFLVIVAVNLQYYAYCKRNTTTCNYHKYWDTPLFKKLFSFISWSVFGSAANAAANQGVNILYNIFCGVIVNAAMGITNQVFAAVSSFVANYQMAFAPQLVKSYAAKEVDYFINLIIRSSRFSYYLIFIIGLPCIFCCETILSIWLVDVPKYTVEFTQLMIIFCFIESTSGPIWTAIQAIGKIKTYQIIISSIILLNLPLAYVLLKLGYSPVYVILVRVLLNVVAVMARLLYLKTHFDFPTENYVKEVLIHCLLITIPSLPIAYYLSTFINGSVSGIGVFVAILVINTVIVLTLGLQKNERAFIFNKIKAVTQKHNAK